MNVLIDTNVALNKLLRQPTFYSGSHAVFKLAEVESFSVDYIVTRNVHDFSSSVIPAVTPEQLIQIITE